MIKPSLDAIGLYKPNWNNNKAKIPMSAEKIGNIPNISFSSAAGKIAEMQKAAMRTPNVHEALLLRFTGEVHDKTGENPLLDDLFNMSASADKDSALYKNFIALNLRYGIKNVQLPSIEVVNGKTYYTLLIPVEDGANTANLKGNWTIYFDENGEECVPFAEAPTSKVTPEAASAKTITKTPKTPKRSSAQPNGNNNNQITHMGLFDPNSGERSTLPSHGYMSNIPDINISNAATQIIALQNNALKTDESEVIWLNLSQNRSANDADKLFTLATNVELKDSNSALYQAYTWTNNKNGNRALQLPSKEEVNGREYYTMLMPKIGKDGKPLGNAKLANNTTRYFNAETGKAAFTWVTPDVDIKNPDAVRACLITANVLGKEYTPEQKAEIADYYMSEDADWTCDYWSQKHLNILLNCIAGMDAQAKSAFKEKYTQRIKSEIENLEVWATNYFNCYLDAIGQMKKLDGKLMRFNLWCNGYDADKMIAKERDRKNTYERWYKDTLERLAIAEKILEKLK